MRAFGEVFHCFGKGGTLVGGVFLIAGMLLLIGNIVGRFVHFVIPGSYELFELFMAIPVAVALVYTGLKGAHVVVNLLSSRFPPRLAVVSEITVSLLSLVTWAMMAYAGADLAYENGLKESSDILGLPYLPFRIFWILCLFIFSLVYLRDIYRIMERVFKK